MGPTTNSTFGTNLVSGLKLLTFLRVSFNHLREDKFKHNFQNTMNQLCPCSLWTEDTYQFLTCCQNFSYQQNIVFNDLNVVNSAIIKMSENDIVWIFLFCYKGFTKDTKIRITTSSIRFIKDSKRFDESLSSSE